MARGGCAIEKRSGNHWGVIIGVIVLIFASTLFAQSDTSKRVGAPDGSTYSPSAAGLSAIYAVLEEAGLARRWEREIRRLPDDVDRLVIWEPESLKDADWKQLDEWVADGGTVIIGTDSARLGSSVMGSAQTSAAPAAVHPATLGVSEIATGGDAFAKPREGALTLVSLANGSSVVVTWARGQGRYYWSADRAWLSNELIGQKSNLDLALGLLGPAKGKQVAFDEYHHGYQAADRWWQLLRGNLQWFMGFLALAAAVLFWAYGARFGAPVPTPAGPSRASVEYILSMSQLYRRARARSIVLQNLQRSLLRDLGRLLGGIGGLSRAEIARRAAERTGLPEQRIAEALERTNPDRRTSDKDLILLTQEVEAIQRSVHNAGYRDQQRTGTGAK